MRGETPAKEIWISIGGRPLKDSHEMSFPALTSRRKGDVLLFGLEKVRTDGSKDKGWDSKPLLPFETVFNTRTVCKYST